MPTYEFAVCRRSGFSRELLAKTYMVFAAEAASTIEHGCFDESFDDGTFLPVATDHHCNHELSQALNPIQWPTSCI